MEYVESLSDDEELHDITYDIDCSKNLQSLKSHQRKVHSRLASQIESLTEDDHQPTFTAYEEVFKQRNPSTFPKEMLQSKSEIQHLVLQNQYKKLACAGTMKELFDSGSESISDEDKDAVPGSPLTFAASRVQNGYTNLEKDSQKQAYEWPSILEEAYISTDLQEKTYNSFNHFVLAEERRFHRGGKGSSSYKFSFRSSNKQDLSWACSSSKDEAYNSREEDIEVDGEQDCFKHRANEDAVPWLLEEKENAELCNKQGLHKHLVGAASVSELLEDMHKTNPSWTKNLAEGNTKGKVRRKYSLKRTLLYLGDRILNNEDEFTGEISSEDEDIDYGYRKDENVKGQTMADVFQGAFNTTTVDVAEIPSNKFGYHGRLQKVMQLEKERHMAYLKQLQTGQTSSDKSKCVEVRILSRTLEAKLIVCQCLFGECNKSSEYEKINQEKFDIISVEGSENGKTMKKTIIFNPTICSHVVLEVGNAVCIHSPWKEVQINGGETLILCTYFSHL